MVFLLDRRVHVATKPSPYPFPCLESAKFWGAELPRCGGFPSTRPSFTRSGSLRQTRAKDVHCGHDCPHSLLMWARVGR